MRRKDGAKARAELGRIRRSPYKTPNIQAGTFALLLTDIERSTAFWEAQPAEMRQAIGRHDHLLTEAISTFGGRVLTDRGEGDSFFALFSRPSEALAAAVEAQAALSEELWPTSSPLRVRMAIHTAEAGSDYRGPDVNRCARLRSLARGGQILVSESAAQLMASALPEGVELVDQGPARLRDFPTPIRVFEVVVAGLPGPLGLPEMAGRPGLPLSLRRFIGRHRELAQLPLQLGSHRLLTLVGPGGIGKTSLAREIGARLAGEYRLVIVDLAVIGDPTLVIGSVGNAVGVRDIPGRTDIELVEAALDSPPTLLLLDNCEHLLTSVAALVTALLGSIPSLRVLATSREPLGIVGELRHLVEPLTRSEAVELFRERAGDANQDYPMGSGDLAHIELIADRLDGMPLAVELAAARLGATSLANLAAHLDRAIHAQPRKVGAAARHETMSAALDWSYRLLTEREQLLLRRLAIFNSGFGLAGAEAVCAVPGLDTESIFEVLMSLVERSFVSVDLTRPDPRYRLLEPVRQFAASHLSNEEKNELDLSFFNWAAAFVATLPQGVALNQELLSSIGEEIANLTAALSAASDLRSGEAIEVALRLEPYWLATGSVRDAIALLERSLSRHPSLDAIRADGLRTLGGMKQTRALGDFGVESCGEAVAIYDRLAMVEEAGEARIRFGAALATSGDPSGLEVLARAARDFRDAGNRSQLARALHRRSFFAARLGVMTAETRADLEESLQIAMEENIWQRIVLVQSELSLLASAEGRVEEAAGHLVRAAAARKGDATMALAIPILLAASKLAVLNGRLDIALEYLAAQHEAAQKDHLGHNPLQEAELANDIATVREKLELSVADAAWRRGLSTPIQEIVAGPDGAGPQWIVELAESANV